MRKIFTAIPFALSIFVCSAVASVSEKEASIEKLFSTIGIDQQMNSGFESMLPIVDQMAVKLELSAVEKEELKSIYKDWFKNDIDRASIKTKIVKVYADTFSEQEINEIIIFYESPIGQRFLQVLPELTKLGAQIGMEEAQSKIELLKEKLKPFLEKHKK